MSLIEDLNRECAQDLDRAKARIAAVDVLKYALKQLTVHRLTPQLTRDAGGLICLQVDLGAFASLPDASPEAPDESCTCRVDITVAAPDAPDGDDSGPDDAAGADDAPSPTPDPAPEPEADADADADAAKPELVTGPVTDEERAVIARMSAAGAGAKEIADRLDRPVGTINVMRRHLKAAIAGLQADCDAPETLPADAPAAKPEQAAPVLGPAVNNKSLLSVTERQIDAHLDEVGYPQGWTATSDLALCEALVRGDGAVGAADEIGRAKAEIVARWKALNNHPGNIDHQTRLLRVLRWRAERVERLTPAAE